MVFGGVASEPVAACEVEETTSSFRSADLGDGMSSHSAIEDIKGTYRIELELILLKVACILIVSVCELGTIRLSLSASR